MILDFFNCVQARLFYTLLYVSCMHVSKHFGRHVELKKYLYQYYNFYNFEDSGYKSIIHKIAHSVLVKKI